MKRTPNTRAIVVPYDSGHRSWRMGAGPEHLMHNGLDDMLRSRERSAGSLTVCPTSFPTVEVATAFELDDMVSRQVNRIVNEGDFPLVLSGNCNTSVGTIAGASSGVLGVVWFDGHADFKTPETTTTGFSDSMGLSLAVGHCWRNMARGVTGFSPVAEEHAVLVGVRAMDAPEKERLDASKVAVVGADRIRREGLRVLEATLEELKGRVDRVYVHLDLDVLDPEEVGRANEFAPAGGLGSEELEAGLATIRELFVVATAGVASYDPAFDTDGRVLRTAIACIEQLAEVGG